MRVINKVSRRTLLAGQAAAAALPGAARAAFAPDAAACAPAGASPAPSTAACAPARWPTATAEELAAHLGERFRVTSPRHGTVVLRLVEVEAHPSGPARPADLPRRAGVTAVFDSPDMAPLVAEGAGIHRVSHPRIGSADLYLAVTPRRHGGHHVEIVLN